ncbi:hypothetical protein VTN77DRAFT_1371 [Rasamsonia byssochlamydoides]|uniref:uncharacterized protein n=1 Tax=Rasamsonia byssochlamydoides TaxID=89139 RepID=UPI003743829C
MLTTTALKFEPNNLYILLSDLGYDYRFHWQLFLATSSSSGAIFYLVNRQDSNTSTTTTKTWVYETMSSADTSDFSTLIVALTVTVIEPILHDSLSDCLAQIPIKYSARFWEDITCRVWVKEALFALDYEGYINLVKSVDAIENEAKSLAVRNKYWGQQSVVKSAGSSV